MRFLKIIGLIVGLPLGAFVVFAIALEVSEHSKPDQSYARSIGMTEPNCVEHLTRMVRLGMLQIAGARVSDFEVRPNAEKECAKRVPWR